MKPGLAIGQTAEVTRLVTADMRPAFDGVVVHDVYGTAAMVTDMEHAARRILLPVLEEHEEGMGVSVSVKHLAPTPVGRQVRAVATLTEFTSRKLVTTVEVYNEHTKIGEGTVVQAVLPKTAIAARIAEMAETE
ncbi:MAG TPA: hotdog domain-containing protein [Bacilli bacterium]|nr:hotdog domain-containing protein [Bacilli bacterium]